MVLKEELKDCISEIQRHRCDACRMYLCDTNYECFLHWQYIGSMNIAAPRSKMDIVHAMRKVRVSRLQWQTDEAMGLKFIVPSRDGRSCIFKLILSSFTSLLL